MRDRHSVLATHAHRLRHAPTESEAKLWRALRASQLGVAFRRQVPVLGFIVDFLAPSARLVVEVDGGYHTARRAADARRDAKLSRGGYRVLRVEAELVICDLKEVLRKIRSVLSAAA